MIQTRIVCIICFALGINLFTHGDIGLSLGQTQINTTDAKKQMGSLNLNLTEPVYRAITGKFLATKELSSKPFPVTEEFFFENAVIKNIGNVTDNMTFINTYLPDGMIQAKGNGTITAKDGQTINWISSDIGVTNSNGPVYYGVIAFKNTTSEKLSFLSNSMGIYKDSPDIKRTIWLIK